MILLDLSAAFDTVDHEELLDILWYELGFRGMVFQWFVEFLRDRRQAASPYNGAQISNCDLRSCDMRTRQKLWSQ